MKEKFRNEEWKILEDAILKLFYSVSYADGNLDADEVGLFISTIKKHNEIKNNLMRDLFENLEFDILDYFDRIRYIDLNNVLNQAKEILKLKLNKNEINEFKLYLVSFSFKIAESSKKYFSNNVTEEEKKVIYDIISFLELDNSDLNYIYSIKDNLPNIIYNGILTSILDLSAQAINNIMYYFNGAIARGLGKLDDRNFETMLKEFLNISTSGLNSAGLQFIKDIEQKYRDLRKAG